MTNFLVILQKQVSTCRLATLTIHYYTLLLYILATLFILYIIHITNACIYLIHIPHCIYIDTQSNMSVPDTSLPL